MFYLTLILGALFLVTEILMVYSTVKKFDGLLLSHGLPLPRNYAFILPDSWGRAVTYAAFILFFKDLNKNTPRYSRYKKLYGRFNFRERTSKNDLVLSLLTCGWECLTVILLVWLFMK